MFWLAFIHFVRKQIIEIAVYHQVVRRRVVQVSHITEQTLELQC